MKTVQVRKNERAILLKDRDFDRILAPGKYHFMNPFVKYEASVFDMNNASFDHALAEYFRRHETDVMNENFHVVDVADDAVVLRYENQNLVEILAPGSRKLFWKWGAPQTFETVNIKESFTVDAKLISYLAQPTLRGKAIVGLQNILPVVVPESHVGLLKVDGKFVSLLKSGKTAYWRFNRDIQVELVDTRLQALEVAGQEILTRDKVSLRINLTANLLNFTQI